MKTKDTKKTTLIDGKEIEFHKDFFLNSLVDAIEKSEGTYSGIVHKTVVISVLRMIFFKFQIAEFMDGMEVSEADYEKWFKSSKKNVNEYIYYKLFVE